MVWQHTVYLGVYQLESIYEHLHFVFPSDEDAYDERPDGRSACAGLVIADDGRLIAESEMLSSALWAVGRTANPGVHNPTWLDGFDDAQKALTESLTDHVADLKNDRGLTEDPRVDEDILQAFLHIAQATAGVTTLRDLATAEIYIASTKVRKDHADELPGYNFLNSFFLDDLGMVAESEFGTALDQYLTSDQDVPVSARIDVVGRPEVVVAGTDCDRIPLGRWLSNPDHPLATSQQFAVNEALRTLGPAQGVMGVNGPPGTGKTTMLRDLLAGNVVHRAQVLASLSSPDEAFTGTQHTWKAGDYPRRVKQLRADLTGYEMIVVSSNNAAVANVSDELPQQRQIHETWHDDADHFAQLASEIARNSFDGDGDPPQSWGLIAARLGNNRNRNQFYSTFWFGKGVQSRPQNPQGTVVHGMQQLLKDWERDASSRPLWEQARINFAAAQTHVENLVAEAASAASRLRRRNTIGNELRAVAQRLSDTGDRLRSAECELTQLQSRSAHLNSMTTVCAAQRARHVDARPSWFESFITAGYASRTWRKELVDFNQALAAAEGNEHYHATQVQGLQRQVSELYGDRGDFAARLAGLRDEEAVLLRMVEADAERYGRCYPDQQWLNDESRRELHGAWQHPDLNRARADLFLAALELHRAFLANASGIRQGLMGSLDVMLGAAPTDLDPHARLAAWQLFFFAVPLISSTFASVGRMLRGVDRAGLGWLLIDEAGQATPQAAVGAIFRSRRVVVVGDPMQLTPVVTIPKRAQHDLAKQFHVDDTFIPSYTSVQKLADRIGRYGTSLRNGTEPTWVSAPLRVHRRCDSPMFEVSNAIAYDGKMINGVHRSAETIANFEHISPSRWIDVADPLPGSHLQTAEIEQLRIEIDNLILAGLDAKEIIAISPFRAVAQELKRVAEDYPGMTGGTIHTAQGREAPVVFLVLGGDPQRSGAKRWASQTPNLVNVAASRAQRRLIVIGDQKAWEQYPNFAVLAEYLTVRDEVPRSS
ncbi:MAG: AAA family ATPase [Gordonia sp. (in: high G+C Gram-positive bacteria)]|nr:MAG: AAA family ATPase [Gordonia sp. (in: high G+C Gram-positive bacteria)]